MCVFWASAPFKATAAMTNRPPEVLDLPVRLQHPVLHLVPLAELLPQLLQLARGAQAQQIIHANDDPNVSPRMPKQEG